MQGEENIFDDGYPHDYQWDEKPNGSLLSIVFVGGCFGNFLKYFVERFSKKTPAMEQNPFTDIGTSHVIHRKEYCGLIQRYHVSFINTNKNERDLPVCLILPTTEPTSVISRKHFLYMQQARIFRAGERRARPDHLWQKAIGEMKAPLRDYAEQIVKLYGIKDVSHFTWLPKFIVRDWYKLAFLSEHDQSNHFKLFRDLESHDFFKKQKTYQLPLESFFDWEIFIREIRKMDDFFDLGLDFDRQSTMEKLFLRGLNLDSLRQEANFVTDVVQGETEAPFIDLDVSAEAFIYAEMEKRHDFVQMPLTNRFFRDTTELMQFIEHYPEHYKAMNPNMPNFNGIPNPYYLKK